MAEIPDLYALVMRLQPLQGQAPLDARGHGAQALFLDVVRQVSPALSEELHAHAPSKPFTVAVLPTPKPERSAPELVELRVSFSRAELFPPVTQALLKQSSRSQMRLGRTALQLVDVIGTPAPQGHAWAGYSSFADLAAQVRPATQLTLQFSTATAISQGSLSNGRQRLGLFPTPEWVFGSIARRWNELAPPHLHLDSRTLNAAICETLISRYRIETQQILLGKAPQKGFVGRCTYELPQDKEAARTLTLLADAVFFLGVGMKTARGMGLCRRID